MPITTTRDEVRLEIGDTDATTPLFNDDELDFLIAKHAGNALLAAAHACDILATRFAGDFDFKTDDQSFSRSQKSKQYAARAGALRVRANGGLGVITTTRVDGYSEDLSTRDGAGQVSPATGRRFRPYYDPDLPY